MQCLLASRIRKVLLCSLQYVTADSSIWIAFRTLHGIEAEAVSEIRRGGCTIVWLPYPKVSVKVLLVAADCLSSILAAAKASFQVRAVPVSE